MLTRAQQILIKRAQAQAGLDDAEYRTSVATVSGMEDCTSSKDARLTDAHVDNLLSYFEAIFWRRVDSGELQPTCKPDAVFRQRGYWAGKNQRGHTSRDRYVDASLQGDVKQLESDLTSLGYGFAYLQAIQNRIRPFSLVKYRSALVRTLDSKRTRLDNQPF